MKKTREIRKLRMEDIDGYLDVYLNAYPAFKSLDEECREKYRRKVGREISQNKEVDLIGLFEDGEMAAFMKIVHFSMNLYGKMCPACGLMSLAVHPLHKKKGLAFAMVQFFEKAAADCGALVTLLLPFRSGFYRKMGYGYGAKMDEYHVPAESLPKSESTAGLKLLTMEDLPQVLACHSCMAEKNHGMLKKFEEEIREMYEDTQVRRIGCFKNGEMAGYLAFRFESASEVNYTLNRISVEEIVYEDGSILRKLLGFLRMQADLAQTVIIRTGEEDFYHLLEDPQDVSGNYMNYGFLQTNVSAMGTMFKILDLQDFVAKTAFRTFQQENINVLFIYDDAMEHCEKKLCISFSEGKWSVDAGGCVPDVTVRCSGGDLYSLLLGSCRLASMIRMGAVEISDPRFAQRLDRLLYCEQKPWSNSDY